MGLLTFIYGIITQVKYVRIGCESFVSGQAATLCVLNRIKGLRFH